jgi:hypothetical protein
MKKQLRSFILFFALFTSSVVVSQPAWQPEICAVTVDSATASYISVIWTKPVATDIDSFYIYRADSIPWNYVKIAAVDYADSSVYDDIAVNVNTSWYKYKISAVDLGGIEGVQSDAANSCWLDVVPNMGAGYYTCQWNVYQNNANPPFNVKCMWDSLGGVAMTQVGGNMSTSWTSWNHIGFSLATSSTYRLEVEISNGCSPERAIINTSRSNLKNVSNPTLLIVNAEQAESLVRAFPNPANGNLNLEWNAAMKIEKISVTDLAGKLVFSLIPNESELKRTIGLNSIESGIYFVNFYSAKGIVSKRVIKE